MLPNEATRLFKTVKRVQAPADEERAGTVGWILPPPSFNSEKPTLFALVLYPFVSAFVFRKMGKPYAPTAIKLMLARSSRPT